LKEPMGVDPDTAGLETANENHRVLKLRRQWAKIVLKSLVSQGE
jgi:hypothetical protein